MPGIHPIDLLAAIILGAAGLRGLFNGMIREVFSVVALGAAVVAVRVWNQPLADWLYDLAGGRIGPTLTPWVSGAAIGIGVVIAVGTFGAVMGRGARAVGLGWADRAGGAALGLAEGALVVGVALTVGTSLLGRTHSAFSPSRSLDLLDRFERATEGGSSPQVAAPPPE